MKARKTAFWLTVAAVSVLTNVGLEVAKQYVPSIGFKRFVDFAHCGPGKAA